MLIQIHFLQNYAPSNLNRDDTGSPKDAIFGGKRRGRISSQCLKRSIRRSETFEEAFREAGLLGTRTRLLPSLIKDELEKMLVGEDAIKIITEKVQTIGRESRKGGEEEGEDNADTEETIDTELETKQLIFIAPNEIPVLAASLLELYQKVGEKAWKKMKSVDITKNLKTELPKSIDIALFGRMTTSGAFEDVEASMQVAHAISTNALSEEFDYYTAVDDISGQSGAGMIGDVEFNSSTYYKYMNIHWEGLVKNLGEDTMVARQAVLALVEAAAIAHPSGKQNSFAAFNLPDFILVEVSEKNLPVSYANAFMKPVQATYDQTLMDASIARFRDYVAQISSMYNLSPHRVYLSANEVEMIDAEKSDSLKSIKNWLSQHLPVKE